MDGDNRITLSPSILLERTHARVEFIFTTVDDGGNYLSPLLPLSKVTKLSLNNEVSGYSVLPSAGEYTATGGGNPDIRGVDYVGDPLLLPERASFHECANEGAGESAFVTKCKERLLPYTGMTPNYIYVAPGVYGEGKEGAMALSYPSIIGWEPPIRYIGSSFIIRILIKVIKIITIFVVILFTVSSPH